jgi:hypothetical protein
LKLEKLFGRLEAILFHEDESSLSLQLLRSDLSEFRLQASIPSDVRHGLEALLPLLPPRPVIPREEGVVLTRILTQLRKDLLE